MLDRRQYLIFSVVFIFLSFLPIKADGAFFCDDGDLATTCYIRTVKTLANGEVISGAGNIVIQNRGNFTTALPTHFFTINIEGDLIIESGGKITGNLALLEAANLNIHSGGRIDVNFRGYAGGCGRHARGGGPGGGGGTHNSRWGDGSGAGYGGNGGRGRQRSTAAGSAYGSLIQPDRLGSGGGGAEDNARNICGGRGGGRVKINVSGTTTINGSITANGANGLVGGHTGGGGGSGGSVWLTTSVLAGNGSITANGGNGGRRSWGQGGGGGGGRIAIHYTTDNFAGSMTAFGGAGHQNGGSGTIFR